QLLRGHLLRLPWLASHSAPNPKGPSLSGRFQAGIHLCRTQKWLKRLLDASGEPALSSFRDALQALTELPGVIPAPSSLQLKGVSSIGSAGACSGPSTQNGGWLLLGLKQKGRDALRKGHCGLRALVPRCQHWDSPAGCQELSEGRLLQGSVDDSQFFLSKKTAGTNPGSCQEARRSGKGKMHKQTRTHCESPREGKDPVPEQVTVSVPQGCREASFRSSNASPSQVLEVPAGVFSWRKQPLQAPVLGKAHETVNNILNNIHRGRRKRGAAFLDIPTRRE
uniref:Uncharacterized protein n=1 Tax=Naja naja TaxID=35670 RepID=A0A8C6VB42_NAJNA